LVDAAARLTVSFFRIRIYLYVSIAQAAGGNSNWWAYRGAGKEKRGKRSYSRSIREGAGVCFGRPRGTLFGRPAGAKFRRGRTTAFGPRGACTPVPRKRIGRFLVAGGGMPGAGNRPEPARGGPDFEEVEVYNGTLNIGRGGNHPGTGRTGGGGGRRKGDSGGGPFPTLKQILGGPPNRFALRRAGRRWAGCCGPNGETSHIM